MAANSKEFKMVLDFMLNVNADKNKVRQLASDVQKTLGTISPDIDFNSEEVKKGIQAVLETIKQAEIEGGKLGDSLEGVDISVNLDDVMSAFTGLRELVDSLSDVSLDELTKAFESDEIKAFSAELDKVRNGLEGVANTDLDENIRKMAEEYDKTTSELSAMISTQQKALSAMRAAGLEGSDAYNKLESEIKQAEEALRGLVDTPVEQAISEAERLANEYNKTEAELKNIIATNTSAMKQLELTGQTGSESYSRFQQEIDEANAKLRKTETTVEDVGKSTKGLGDKFATAALAMQGIDQVFNTLKTFTDPFEELDKQVRNIGTLGVKNFKEFADSATELSKKVPDSAGTLVSGVYDAISAGMIKVNNGVADVSKGMQFMETSSKLAIAGMIDTKTAVNTLAGVVNAYGDTSENASKYSDILFNGVIAGKTTVSELAASLSNVTPLAGNLGVTFDQVTAAIATMANQGLPTAQATTQIRQALVELSKPGAELAPIMQKAGVSLDSLKAEGLQVSLAKIGDEMTKSGKIASQVFSSVEAASAAMMLSGKNAARAATDWETIKNGVGSTENAFAIASEGIGVKSQLLMNKLQAAFNDTMGVLGDTGQTVLATATKISPLITSFAGVATVLPVEKLEALHASLGKVATSVLTKVIPSLGAQSAATAGATTAQTGLNAAMLANPVAAVAAAVAVLVIGLTLFFTKTEKGKAILDSLSSGFQALMKKLEPVLEAVIGYGEAMMDTLIDIGGAVFEFIVAPFEIAITWIQTIISTFLDLIGISGGSVDVFQLLAEVFNKLSSVAKFVGDAFSMIGTYVSATTSVIKGFISNLPELLGTLLEYAKYYLNPVNWISGDEETKKALDAKMKNVVSKMMDGAVSVINNSNIGNAIEDALTIKGDLDKNKQLDKLVAQYEQATTDIEKKSIAEAIAKQAPEAVAGTREIIDAQGNIVEVMDINVQKAKELSSEQKNLYGSQQKTAQKDFIDGLKLSAEQFDNNKQRSKELAKQIVEQSKQGLDTTKLQDEYKKLQKTLSEQSGKIRENLGKATEVGIDITGTTFSPEFNQSFANELAKLDKKAEEFKIGEKITETLKIKENLDGTDKIGELKDKFAAASSDMEKASIAEKLKKVAPEAVKATGTVTDANGNLIKTYEINSDKLDEITKKNKELYSADMLKKQGEIVQGIKDEGNQYSTNIDKMKKKQEEIDAAIKNGGDTKELEKQFSTLNTEAQKSKDNMIEYMVQSKSAGVDTEQMYQEVAKTLGMSTDEVKKMVNQQVESKKKTEDQKKAVDDLAAAWDNAKTSLDNSVKTQLSALNELDKKRRSGAKLTPEEQARYEQTLKEAKANVQQSKTMDKINESNQLLIGLKEKSKGAAESALSSAKSEADLINSKLETDLKVYELAQKQIALDENRKQTTYEAVMLQRKELETIDKQKQAWIDILKKKNIINDIKSDGTIVFSSKVKPAEKSDITKSIIDFNNKIIEQRSKLEDLKIKVKLDEEQLKEKILEFEKKKIEFEMSIGIRDAGDYGDLLKIYKDKGEAVKLQIDENSKKIADAETNMAKEVAAAQERQAKIDVTNTLKQYEDKIAVAKEGNQKLSDVYSKMNTEIASLGSNADAKSVDKIKKKYEKEISAATKSADDANKVFDKIRQDFASQGLVVSDTEIENAMEKYRQQTQLAENNTAQIIELTKSMNAEIAKLGKKATKEQREEIKAQYAEKIKAVAEISPDIAAAQAQFDKDLSEVFVNSNADTVENIKIKFNEVINTNKSANLDLQNQIMENDKSIADIRAQGFSERINKIKSDYEAESAAAAKHYDSIMNDTQRLIDTYGSIAAKQADSANSSALDKIKSLNDDAVKELDKLKEDGLLTEEDYEKRKLEIQDKYNKISAEQEKKHQKELASIAASNEGALLEIQRRKENKTLQMKADSVSGEMEIFAERKGLTEEQSKELYDVQAKFLKAQTDAAEHYGDAEYALKRDNAKKELEILQSKYKFTNDDKSGYKNMVSTLEETRDMLKEKGTEIGIIGKELQTTVTDSVTEMFSGDPEEAAETWRKFLSKMVGMLEAKLSAFVLDLILTPSVTQYISTLPFPANLAAIPVITGLTNAAVRKVAEPLLDQIVSFGYGGSVDERTLALIGDNPGGGNKREWIFDDPQLQSIVQMATGGMNTAILSAIQTTNAILSTLNITSDVGMGKLRQALRTEEIYSKSRYR